MKRIIFSLILIVLWCQHLNGQCSVTKEKGSHSTTYVSKMEKVYLNEDLENGANKYELRIVLQIDTNVVVPAYYMLQCKYTNSGEYRRNECAPRSIVFEFMNGEFKGPVWALTEEETPSTASGFQSRIFNYEITLELLRYLQSTSIKHISFWDKRTGNGVPSSPYKDLFKEQIDCLIATSGINFRR